MLAIFKVLTQVSLDQSTKSFIVIFICTSITMFTIDLNTIHLSYFAVRPRPQLIRGGTVQGLTQATLLAQIAGLHCTNHQCSVALFVGLFPLTTIIVHPEMKGECLNYFMLAHIMTNYKITV